MALADQDRIFTNLYSQHDWRLKAAQARGVWDAVADSWRLAVKRLSRVKAQTCAGAAARAFRLDSCPLCPKRVTGDPPI